MGVKLGRAKF